MFFPEVAIVEAVAILAKAKKRGKRRFGRRFKELSFWIVAEMKF